MLAFSRRSFGVKQPAIPLSKHHAYNPINTLLMLTFVNKRAYIPLSNWPFIAFFFRTEGNGLIPFKPIFDSIFVLGDTLSREEAASARFGRSAKGSDLSEAFGTEGIFLVLFPSVVDVC